ncbi:MAG: anthranilate phosphoribosyltransferase [Candidatus Saganbacteria bacterium]|uniref:Anthranilate phosphoribosyltransferase n=1 Tax=Candidatus Saganbacteria bacterium TaxID=2575572 RepID=A0A833P316_UNCSA|nr:MAG: anthranilate phosphoribosyltransferase [Candidatus Saganbacteria bacterium]
MIKEAILKVIEGKNLTCEEAAFTADTIMRGEANQTQIASLLTALRIKGETVDEIVGFAKQMIAHAVKIKPNAGNLVDTCGTGGDVSHTFNISTVSALVAAGAQVKIAKHGNRSVSSKCGSADLLEALGVKIDLSPERVAKCIDDLGFGFIYAPNFHPAMKHAGPVRREIGFRTIFNVLGPLTNPAGAARQVLGVYSEKLTDIMAKVLLKLGVKHALVVYGMDGLDEISISDKTKISEVIGGKIKNYYVKPEDFGIKKAKRERITAGNVEQSKSIALDILEQHTKCPALDVVLLNAGAAIYISGLAKSIKEGIKLAEESIILGEAFKKLEALRKGTGDTPH